MKIVKFYPKKTAILKVSSESAETMYSAALTQWWYNLVSEAGYQPDDYIVIKAKDDRGAMWHVSIARNVVVAAMAFKSQIIEMEMKKKEKENDKIQRRSNVAGSQGPGR